MNHARRMGLAVAAGAFLSAGWLGGGGAQASASQIQVGVWSQSGGAPAPPTVPSGGLWVSSSPNGPTAISAVRISLAAGDTAPQLTLHVAQFNQPPSTPAAQTQSPILACAAQSQWQPTDPATPGALTAAPTYDCSKGQALGTPSSDNTTFVFDLTAFEDSTGTVNVVVVPGQIANPVQTATAPSPQPPPSSVLGGVPSPPAPAPTPADPTAPTAWPSFDATFNPPAASDVSVIAAPAAATVATPDQSSAPDLSASADSVPLSAPSVLPSTVADATVAAPATLPTDVVAPSPPAAPARARSAVLPRRLQPVASVIDPTSKTARTLTGLVFLALCGWAWQLFSRSGGLASNGLLSLYDMPESGPIAASRKRFGTAARHGRPPSLR